MDLSIAAILAQDGITSGAVYALLALALVLVFSVTRIIFIPQGEFVTYGALTLAAIQNGKAPQTASLLLVLGALCWLKQTFVVLRMQSAQTNADTVWRGILLSGLTLIALPLMLCLSARHFALQDWPLFAQVVLALAMVVPMGPMIYRLAYQPLAQASTLVLLIVSVGVHFALTGLGLVMFGAEGSRTTALSDAHFEIGALMISGQSLVVIAVSALFIGCLYFYFERSLSGKALRATAVNRLGAQLVGIGTQQAGRLAFTLAATIGALCGVLIAPMTTVYYDGGFLIGLKGFVGAIVGGLVSYPLAAAGAILVGLLESYSSFWASAYKEVIVFTLIIPVLLWRSLTTKTHDEDEEA
ncbi:branched-chain amino acid ABC transporter permease [Undibacterium sp. SXout11W]|uniref:branched-chain amino acid ABC transporter permease n=1 Tax=Undibacterium sp. SXout11W TaxID=3413050 RepID=UPI003BF192FE